MANQDLPISQLVLATALNGEELLPFAKDNANGALLVSLLKTYIRDGLATQEAVNTKQNKLTAGYGIEITADNKIKSTLDVSLFKIVDTLPTENIETKIYLVADPAGKEGENEYIEYMYVNNQWEQIGKYTALLALSSAPSLLRSLLWRPSFRPHRQSSTPFQQFHQTTGSAMPCAMERG